MTTITNKKSPVIIINDFVQITCKPNRSNNKNKQIKLLHTNGGYNGFFRCFLWLSPLYNACTIYASSFLFRLLKLAPRLLLNNNRRDKNIHSVIRFTAQFDTHAVRISLYLLLAAIGSDGAQIWPTDTDVKMDLLRFTYDRYASIRTNILLKWVQKKRS